MAYYLKKKLGNVHIQINYNGTFPVCVNYYILKSYFRFFCISVNVFFLEFIFILLLNLEYSDLNKKKFIFFL
jgi:hypothetical protein